MTNGGVTPVDLKPDDLEALAASFEHVAVDRHCRRADAHDGRDVRKKFAFYCNFA